MKMIQVFLLVALFTVLVHAETNNYTYTQAGTAYATSENGGYGVVLAITNSAPAAGAFVASSDDTLTDADHWFLTGLKGQVSTTTTLPGGLSAATDYFVIYQSSSVYKLATSLVNALAGTAINITDAGTGTHTFTPTSLAGASVKLQCSMDGSAYADMPIRATGDVTKSASITATGNVYLHEEGLACNYVRHYVTITAGQLSIVSLGKVKAKVVP